MTHPDMFGCPHCARTVRRADRYCPGCGYRIGLRVLCLAVNGASVTMRVRSAVPPARAEELEDFD